MQVDGFGVLPTKTRTGVDAQGRFLDFHNTERVPSTGFVANGSSPFTYTDRDVDYWGGSLEAKFWGRDPVQVRPNLLRTDYLLIGAAIRGIDQNNDLNGSSSARTVFKYNEGLNTTYYGGYIGFGGEYSLGFLRPVGEPRAPLLFLGPGRSL
jgi:hypothetical protein